MSIATRSVIDDMESLAMRYKETFGRNPLGFVIGAKDIHALWEEMQHVGHSYKQTMLPARIHGLPIYYKATSGIELLMDQSAVLSILSKSDPNEAFRMIKKTVVR